MSDTPDNQTIEFTTPVDNHKVLFKAFATGFDQEAIDAAYNDTSYLLLDEAERKKVLPPIQRANRKAFELLVVSVDDDESDVVGAVLAMKLNDYRSVVAKIDELTEGEDDKKKLNQPSSTKN